MERLELLSVPKSLHLSRVLQEKSATFYLAGGVGVLGTVIYYFLPEGRAVDLKVMDEEFEEYPQVKGYVNKEPEDSS